MDSKDKKTLIGQIAILILFGALIVFGMVRLWGGMGDSKVDVGGQNTPTVTSTPTPVAEVETDELYSDLMSNIKADIVYILGNSSYKKEYMKEEKLADVLIMLREKYGKQSVVSISMSYVDKDLCNLESKSYVSFVFSLLDERTGDKSSCELRIVPAKKTGNNGKADAYIVTAEVFTE